MEGGEQQPCAPPSLLGWEPWCPQELRMERPPAASPQATPWRRKLRGLAASCPGGSSTREWSSADPGHGIVLRMRPGSPSRLSGPRGPEARAASPVRGWGVERHERWSLRGNHGSRRNLKRRPCVGWELHQLHLPRIANDDGDVVAPPLRSSWPESARLVPGPSRQLRRVYKRSGSILCSGTWLWSWTLHVPCRLAL